MDLMSLANLFLLAGSVLVFIALFAHFFFGLKRVLAGTAVLAGIVVIGMLPSPWALAALVVGFVALISLTTYRQMKATVFATGAADLLRRSLVGCAVESLPMIPRKN